MTNKEIAYNFYQDVWNAHDISRLDDYVQPDYIQHSPRVGQGREGLREMMKGFFKLEAYHDIQFILEDGDMVAVYMYVTFNNGKHARVTDIFRIRDGKMAEHWDSVTKE